MNIKEFFAKKCKNNLDFYFYFLSLCPISHVVRFVHYLKKNLVRHKNTLVSLKRTYIRGALYFWPLGIVCPDFRLLSNRINDFHIIRRTLSTSNPYNYNSRFQRHSGYSSTNHLRNHGRTLKPQEA